MELEKFVFSETDPNIKCRFVLEFPKEFGIDSFAVQKVNRPKLINYEWQDFEIYLLDIIEPSTSKSIAKMIDYCKDAKNTREILFSFSILTLDARGIKLNTWKIDVAELVDVDFGTCDYEVDDFQIIKVTLKPLNCTLS